MKRGVLINEKINHGVRERKKVGNRCTRRNLPVCTRERLGCTQCRAGRCGKEK
jgi:hypothetical protein